MTGVEPQWSKRFLIREDFVRKCVLSLGGRKSNNQTADFHTPFGLEFISAWGFGEQSRATGS